MFVTTEFLNGFVHKLELYEYRDVLYIFDIKRVIYSCGGFLLFCILHIDIGFFCWDCIVLVDLFTSHFSLITLVRYGIYQEVNSNKACENSYPFLHKMYFAFKLLFSLSSNNALEIRLFSMFKQLRTRIGWALCYNTSFYG